MNHAVSMHQPFFDISITPIPFLIIFASTGPRSMNPQKRAKAALWKLWLCTIPQGISIPFNGFPDLWPRHWWMHLAGNPRKGLVWFRNQNYIRLYIYQSCVLVEWCWCHKKTFAKSDIWIDGKPHCPFCFLLAEWDHANCLCKDHLIMQHEESPLWRLSRK